MSLDSGASLPAIMVATSDGRFFISAENPADNCADSVLGQLSISASAVSGSGSFSRINFVTFPAVQIDCTYDDGATWGNVDVSGSVGADSTLTLSAQYTTSLGTSIPGTMSAMNFDTLYQQASSLSQVAGTWTSQNGSTLSVNSNGMVSSQDSATGCVVNGQISLVDSSYDAFAVTMTYSGCLESSSTLNGLTATGLAAVDASGGSVKMYLSYGFVLPTNDVVIVADSLTQ
jgi:hypothetical protein